MSLLNKIPNYVVHFNILYNFNIISLYHDLIDFLKFWGHWPQDKNHPYAYIPKPADSGSVSHMDQYVYEQGRSAHS